MLPPGLNQVDDPAPEIKTIARGLQSNFIEAYKDGPIFYTVSMQKPGGRTLA